MPNVETMETLSAVMYSLSTLSVIIISLTVINMNLKYIDKIQLLLDFFAISLAMYFVATSLLKIKIANI